MNNAEHNLRLLQEIEENRRALLLMYQQNPEFLKCADKRIAPLLKPLATDEKAIAATQRGISLIELIVFIVIISVALAGILLVMNQVTRSSADPLIRKQALAVAESMLEEIKLQDFVSASGVTVAVTQVNRASDYHVVGDYNGYDTATFGGGIYPVSGVAPIPGLGGYSVAVAVTPTAWNGIPAVSAVLITVTVTTPQGDAIPLSGYRAAY